MENLIRRAIFSDITRLQEIRAAVRENILSDPSKITAEDYRWFIQHGPLWVYERDNQILGFTAGDPRDGSVWALFVDPPYEGQGIGRALFKTTCRSLFEAGHKEAKLYTDANSRAAKFYSAAGWQGGAPNEKGEAIFTRDFDFK